MSATPIRRVPVTVLRETARRAVAATSTHQTAKAIGLSQSWLRKFLDGAEPHASTVDVLCEWHERYTRERAVAAVDALVEFVPGGDPAEVRRELLDVLRTAYERLGVDPPDWLAR